MEIHEKYQDKDTGEMVTRIKIPEKLLAEIEKHVLQNSQHANNFMQLSRQIVQLTRTRDAEFDAASKSEQDVGKEVVRIREKMGIDSSWIYNIPLRLMEKRDPPPEATMIEEGVKP